MYPIKSLTFVQANMCSHKRACGLHVSLARSASNPPCFDTERAGEGSGRVVLVDASEIVSSDMGSGLGGRVGSWQRGRFKFNQALAT